MYSLPSHVKEHQQAMQPQVRCVACRHAIKFRAFSEVIDCTQKNKMQNAEVIRNCFAFELA